MLGQCTVERPSGLDQIDGIVFATIGFPAFLFDELRHRYTLDCCGCHDLGGSLALFDFADATGVGRQSVPLPPS